MEEKNPALVIVTDLHHRITGVSATIRNLVLRQREQLNLRLWSKLPLEGFEKLSLYQLYRLLKRTPSDRTFHIWHARRNNEMQWALFFKYVLRCPIKIVFTSAAIRRHSAFPRWLISRMDAVIATSEKASALLNNVSAVVYHGVDTNIFRPVESREAAIARLNVNFMRAVGQFGRIRPEKGSDYFVETMIKLLPRYPEYGAVLVGKVTPQFELFSNELKRKVAAAGLEDRIIWHGEVPFDQVPGIYNAMSIVVAPSRYEGFGLTPLESMATGTPVVAADTGAYKAIIDQGKTGYVFPIHDMNAFETYLSDLMGDDAKVDAMQDACRSLVVEHFSIEREINGIAEVYRTIWEGPDAQSV